MRKKSGRRTNLVQPGEPPEPPGRRIFEFEFPAATEAKNETLEALLKALEDSGALAQEADLFPARLCLDEALINAVMHGSQYDSAKQVRVRAYSDGASWSVVIEDQGPGFKEEDLPDPDADENLLEESGRGVLLMRRFMGKLAYYRGGACVVMSRALTAPRTTSVRTRKGTLRVPLTRRVRDLEAILEITRAMAAETDLTRLLILLAKASSKVLQAERTSIWVVDPRTGELFTRVAEGTDGIRIPAGAGIVGAVAAAGEPLLIPDAYADARFNPAVDKKTGFTTREILCHPLKNADGARVVGVLQALNKSAPDGSAFDAYDQELAGVFAAQAGVVLEEAALREMAESQKRMQAEMDLARTIQQGLLPKSAPEIKGLDIAGATRPATECSGDYFDYVMLPGGALGALVADVTGHGLGAALIMTGARACVRSLCTAASDPAQVLSAANNMLAKDLDGGNFLSLCLTVLDPRDGTLRYSSAGHDPPLFYRPSAPDFMELDSTGPLLGIVENMAFHAAGPFKLQSGDVLLLMTDGLFECMNAAEETFGKERIKEILKLNRERNAQEILAALLAAADIWTGGQPPRDDITAVVVKVGDGF